MVLQVLLVPSSSVGCIGKEGVVTDHVSLDQTDAGPFHLPGQVVQMLENGPGIQIVGQAGIPSPDQDQVPVQNPVFLELPLVTEAGLESEVGSQTVQNRRRGEDLHVAGRNEVLQGIPGIENGSPVDVAHIDSPRGPAVTIAVQQGVDLPRQAGIGPAGVLSNRRLRTWGGRGWVGVHFDCSGPRLGGWRRCRAGPDPKGETDGDRCQESQDSAPGEPESPAV